GTGNSGTQALGGPGVLGAPRFLVVGAFVLDCLVSTSRLPGWGQDVRAEAMWTVPGGKALNQAVTLARLGAQVAAVGAVGADVVGAAVRAALVGEGVDVSAMAVIPDTPTPVCIVHVRDDGEKAVVWRVPDALAVTPDQVQAAAATCGPADAALVTFEFAERAPDLIAAAAKAAMRVVVNPAPAPTDPAVVRTVPWEQVDLLVPNEAEARALLAGRPAARGPAGRLAEAVCETLGVPTVCVTHGERGCVVRTGGATTIHPAVAAGVIDTTGASDAFTAVLAARLVAGADPATAVRHAQAAAALTVSRVGAYEALPTVGELCELVFGLPKPSG
ncbi:PfkB family carbohydrate kinase, partial [Frankia gtarii]|uniref:PfkB family carbohydrate kinase n=1 Tax=Frankia gtarii TaxID=2950102 RepID=UPI003F6877CC